LAELTKKNVLIIGSGGREHALGWKIAKSSHINKIFFAPGNGGTCTNINIQPNELDRLMSFAKENGCISIVGPENPLAGGIVDLFQESGLEIFGPTKEASKLESSKFYAKQFMRSNNIKTPRSASFSDPQKAKDYINSQKIELVVKADGLAAGKGVIVCNSPQQAINAIDTLMNKKIFGPAAERVIVEERMQGEEISFIVISDGKTVIPLASSRDHKRLLDNDQGPNTGGMGSYSPSTILDDNLHDKIMKDIMMPTVVAMRQAGNEFKGFLYAGLIIENHTKDPYVLEFNVRMGDPECQVIMVRMKSDIFEYVQKAIYGQLDSMPPIEWENKHSVCIIMAAKGYPEKYEKGHLIQGLDSDFGKDVIVFHSGTKRDSQNNVFTNGGRVLAITSLGNGLNETVDKGYRAVRKISWSNNSQHYRTDIGKIRPEP
jgi:phosphoribosylamine---glycine ligase